jgi:hypothetical protein
MTSSRIRRFRTAFLFSLALVAASAGSAAAQQRTSVIPIDSLARVRITRSAAEPSRTGGAFLGADSQAVVVQGAEGRYEVPLGEIRKLEVSRGERSVEAGVWRGATRGFIGGLVVGALLGGLVMTGEKQDYITNELIAGLLVVSCPVTGALLGARIGAAYPGERWERVPLPQR